MINDIINYIGKEKLEQQALLCHRPSNAVYVYVKEDGSYKVVQNWQKVDFNSKHRGWDFYSCLISMNKPISSKVIQSNNYYTFWCRNIAKLKVSEIESYFEKLELPNGLQWHKDWVIKNIYRLGEIYNNELIKIFFPGTRESYREQGFNYWLEKCISVPAKKNYKYDTPHGVPIGYSISAKKPFSTAREPYLVTNEDGLYIKFVYDIFKGCTKRGYDNLYITPGGIYFSGTKKEPPDIKLNSSIYVVTKINNKGEVEILDMEAIPTYEPYL